MIAKTPEELKRYYRDLTDDQLREEYRYRMGISTRRLGCAEVETVINSRKAVWELMKERWLLGITESH